MLLGPGILRTKWPLARARGFGARRPFSLSKVKLKFCNPWTESCGLSLLVGGVFYSLLKHFVNFLFGSIIRSITFTSGTTCNLFLSLRSSFHGGARFVLKVFGVQYMWFDPFKPDCIIQLLVTLDILPNFFRGFGRRKWFRPGWRHVWQFHFRPPVILLFGFFPCFMLFLILSFRIFQFLPSFIIISLPVFVKLKQQMDFIFPVIIDLLDNFLCLLEVRWAVTQCLLLNFRY